MGGYAFVLKGKVEERLVPPPAKPSLLQRLLGRPPEGWVHLGDTLYRELPADSFQPFLEAFRQWLQGELEAPWPATRVVLEYLEGPYTELLLRGERSAAEAEAEAHWYLQTGFSGCAGQAEVSSRVAAHWAGKWYAAEGERVAERLLAPAGFMVTGPDDGLLAETLAFYPLDEGGYALYHEEPSPWFDDDGEEHELHFEVDDAALETCPGLSRRLLRLEAERAAEMADGLCRCQLCRPG